GLLAIHDVVIAVAHRRGLHRGEVGTGPGFGIALAPPIEAIEYARQPVTLLSLGAVFDQDRPQHAYAKRHDARRAGQGTLILENEALHSAPAGAAIFLR